MATPPRPTMAASRSPSSGRRSIVRKTTMAKSSPSGVVILDHRDRAKTMVRMTRSHRSGFWTCRIYSAVSNVTNSSSMVPSISRIRAL